MAHFARVQNGIVMQVVAVNNDAIDGGQYPESQPVGQAMLAESGFDGEWLQASLSGAFRAAFPAVGWQYDAHADAFTDPTDAPAE